MNYDLGIGLGVYDIDSPRIPTKEEITTAINRSLQQIMVIILGKPTRFETRKEEEVKGAIATVPGTS